MKLNKKRSGLFAGVVCVILSSLLLLTMNGCGKHNAATEPVGTTEAIPVVTESHKETEVSTEATAETEEATEATEETTEPTEEATQPTTGNSGYYPNTGDDDDDSGNQETVVEMIPSAGSEGSPYTEMIASLPDGFRTVSIPADSPVFHNVYIEAASILTIQDADAFIVYGGTKYEADDEGNVSISLAKPEKDTPVLLQIGNKNEEDKAFDLTFAPGIGSRQNPEIIHDAESVVDGKWTVEYVTKLDAGNLDGYWYQYTAADKGTLILRPAGDSGSLGYDVIVTVGENAAKLSESNDGTASMEVKAGDVVMIQVVVVPAEDGTYPALDVTLNCTMQYAPGTIQNPASVNDLKTIQVGPLEPGEEAYYFADDISGVKLLISDADAYIRIGEEKHVAESGRVLVDISTDGRIAFAVGNAGKATETYNLNINHPLGTKLNPARLTLNKTFVVSSQKDYYYSWNATGVGKLTLTIASYGSEWSCAIHNTTTGEYKEMHAGTDDAEVLADAVGFSKGDVIQVIARGQVSFTTKAGKKDASAVSDMELQLGANELKTVSTATTTVYKFTPAEVGTYTFETTAGTLSYWGSSVAEMAKVTANETAMLTQSVTEEGACVLVGVTGTDACTLTVTKTVDYGTETVPVAYELTLSETQKIQHMDLAAVSELYRNEADGRYYLAENGPLVLVDFTSDSFVNLVKLLEKTQLYCEITTEDGSVIRETYSSLLRKYISSAQVIAVSAEETRTLYPLTDDLMYVLKQVGKQLGWYDQTNPAYLFGDITDANAENLWMFCCCTVQDIPAQLTEEPVAESAVPEEMNTDPTEE